MAAGGHQTESSREKALGESVICEAPGKKMYFIYIVQTCRLGAVHWLSPPATEKNCHALNSPARVQLIQPLVFEHSS